MKKGIFILIFLMLSIGAIWYTSQGEEASGTTYRFVTVERGDLEAIVSSTGNIRAVIMVQVGTQVSGIIDEIFVDFNDRVRKGQVVAKIDTTLLMTAIQESRAGLQRARAQQVYSQSEYDRVEALFLKQFSTEVEMNRARYDLQMANSSFISAELNLQRSERNLSYATITSPIDGVVIERSVDVGQTVAASLSAPQLFLVANTLDKLQILASVDESDIGKIKDGMRVRFTVQAHDEAVFEAVVRQVRLQSTVQENVVTYTVVVDVDNSDGRLLPGMTATVDFLIETATDVTKVANAALRFRPTEEMMAAVRARFENQRSEGRAGDSSARAISGQSGQRPGPGNASASLRPPGTGQGGPPGGNSAVLWYLDETGQPAMKRVRTGITDGTTTEIMGRDLEAGLDVIAGVSQVEAEGGFSNPFQNNQQQGRRRGGF